MTSRAHVEYDPMMLGVKIAVTRGPSDGRQEQVLKWAPVAVSRIEEDQAAPDEAWLRLPEDDARALYEALADHFGHAGHDTRALRKDYDAERKRVDLFIAHLTGAAR